METLFGINLHHCVLSASEAAQVVFVVVVK